MALAAAKEVDDWITPSTDGPDDWITGEAAPSRSSALGSFARGAERGALPAAGGFAGAAGAIALAEPAIQAAAAASGPAAPITEVVGHVGAGLAGAFGGAAAVQEAQQWALDHMPEKFVKALGLDKEQRQADTEEHPVASLAGELAPNLALVRPGAVAKTAREGAGALERAMSGPVGARAVPATVMAAQEAANEKAHGEDLDPAKISVAAGVGALSNRTTALGEKVGRFGAAPIEAVRNRLHPGPTPDEVAAPVMAAESADDAIAAAKAQVDQPGIDVDAMAETARAQGEQAEAQQAAAAPKTANAKPGEDWVTLHDEDGAEIGWYHPESEEIRLNEAVPGEPAAPAPAEAAPATGEVEDWMDGSPAPEPAPQLVKTQPSARESKDYLDAKTKADTYATWLEELDAKRRQDALSSPQAKFLQQNIDAILRKVNGVEERLTKSAATRLANARNALETLQNQQGDSPDMARVRAAMVTEHQRMADAVVAHRDQVMARAQAAREAARALDEELPDEAARAIGDHMVQHGLEADAAVGDHLETQALGEVRSDHGQTGAYPEAESLGGRPGEIDSGAGAGIAGREVLPGAEGLAGETGAAAPENPGQAHQLGDSETTRFARRDDDLPRVEATSRYGDLSSGTARLKSFEDALKNSRGTFHNAETGWDIEVTRKGLSKSLSGDGPKVRAEIVANLPALLEHARLTETHPDTRGRGYAAIHRMNARFVLDGRENNIKLTVRENTEGVKRHYAVDYVEVEPVARIRDTASAEAPTTQPGSAHNIENGSGPFNNAENGRTINDIEGGGETKLRRSEAAELEPLPVQPVKVRGVFTPEFDAAREKVGSALRQRLNDLGLKEIALKLPDAIIAGGEHVDGAFAKKIIAVALDSRDPAGTLDHEGIHALRSLGLFNKSEWNLLNSKAAREWRTRYGIDKRYGDLSEDKRNEEAVAEAFRYWRKGMGNQKGIIARLFNKMRNALEAVGNAIRGHGFQTPDDIFHRVEAGEVGARPRGDAPGEQTLFQYREKTPDGDSIPMRAVYIKATGKVEFRPVPQPTPKTPSAEPATPRAKALRSIEGTGSERKRAINGEIYNVGEEAPQLEAAQRLIEKSPEDAIAIAMRQKQPPAGIHPEFVYMAVEAKAIKDGDVELQRKLSTSKIAEEATTMGQRIAAWRNRGEINPVEDMRRIDEARAETAKRRGTDAKEAVTKMVDQAQSEIRKSAKSTKRPAWGDFVLSLVCPT